MGTQVGAVASMAGYGRIGAAPSVDQVLATTSYSATTYSGLEAEILLMISALMCQTRTLKTKMRLQNARRSRDSLRDGQSDEEK
jgi:hypothetical protein